MDRRRHRERALGARIVAGLLVAAGLTGCVAGSSPPGSATPSTKVPPGIGESTLGAIPPAARVESRDGALAYIAHYLAQVNAGSRRGDSTPAAKLGAEGCDGCRQLSADIAEVTGGGAVLAGDYWRSTKGSLHSRRGHLWAMLVSVDQRGQDSHDPAGRVVASVPDRHLRVLFTLEFNGSWRVVELQVQ